MINHFKKVYIKNMILTFLCKFFFILKAASDGWCINYIGGNKFTFMDSLKNKRLISEDNFLNIYKNKFLEFCVINL